MFCLPVLNTNAHQGREKSAEENKNQFKIDHVRGLGSSEEDW
jgi:hypothetical protein